MMRLRKNLLRNRKNRKVQRNLLLFRLYLKTSEVSQTSEVFDMDMPYPNIKRHAELVSAPHHIGNPLAGRHHTGHLSPGYLSREDLACGVPKQVRHDFFCS